MEFGFGTHCAQLHRDSLQEGGQSTAFLTPSERPQTGEVFFGTKKRGQHVTKVWRSIALQSVT